MADIATLGIKVDSSQAAKASENLDKLAESSANAGKAADGAAKQSDVAAKASDRVSTAADRAGKSLGSMAAAMARGDMSAASRQISNAAASSVALAGSLSAAGVVAYGVIGAVVGLAVAYNKGSKESDEYNRAIIMTGNAAGTTAGQLQVMAGAISDVVGTQHNAAAALAQFAANGNIANASLERFATLAVRLERDVGQSVGDTVKAFSDLGKDPVQASERLNEKLRYLTSELYVQIKALDDHGRTAEAAQLAQDAYFDQMSRRATELENRLGYIDRAWRSIKDTLGGWGDKALDIGRPQTLEDQLGKMQKALADRTNAGPLKDNDAAFQKGNDALRMRIAMLADIIDMHNASAQQERDAAAQTAARVAFDKQGERYLGARVMMEREIAKARAQAAVGRVPDDELNARIAAISERYTPKAGKDNSAEQIASAKLKADIDAINKAQEAASDAFSNAEKIMEAKRAAMLLSDAEYYDAKRAFVKLNADAQEKALTDEIARLEVELGAGNLRADRAIDVNRRITDAEAKLAKVRADAVAKKVILDTQETASTDKVARAYAEAEAAAKAYVDTIARQQTRALDSMGKGQLQRERDQAIAQVEDKYADQRLRLESDKRSGKLSNDEYDKELALIEKYQSKATAIVVKGIDDRIEKEKDWTLGASEALANYADDAANVYKQTSDVVTKAFRGMEDALVSFVTTGKLDFASLANSIIADIVRIQVKAMISGATTGGGFLSGLMAVFGSHKDGLAYVPYDNYPALLHKGERVLTANENSRGSGSISVVNNVTAGINRNELMTAMQMTQAATEASIMRTLKNAMVV